MKNLFSILFLFIFCINTYAQEISNVTFQQVGKTIEVSYDLSGTESGTIELFYSTNDGKSYNGPLKAVTGAVGKNQKSGNKKKIVWDVLAEGVEFTGNVKFKVKYKSGKYGTITDKRDGKTYKTVKIGNQEWMAENLAYKPSSGNYWAYDKDNTNVAKYGYLYDWNTAKKVCPTSWHLPSDRDWTVLTDHLGGHQVAGVKMKSISGWKDGGKGTNESGFNAFPGGYRNSNGHFGTIGNLGYWWSSSENDAYSAWRRELNESSGYVNRLSNNKTYGFSVRCLRD